MHYDVIKINSTKYNFDCFEKCRTAQLWVDRLLIATDDCSVKKKKKFYKISALWLSVHEVIRKIIIQTAKSRK